MGNKVCDIIEVAAGKNCTPSARMSNLKCDPSGAVPGTVIPSVPDASVVNDCCTPSPVMPQSRSRSTTFALISASRGIIILLQSRVEHCDTRLAMIIKINMHAHEKGFRSISVINFCDHGCLGHWEQRYMPACRRWHNACSLVLKPGLDENGLTCVIHDLSDGPCTGGMNADAAVCNLRRSDPCCGRSYRHAAPRAQGERF